MLRTHTSPVQIRTMLAQKPPIRIIAPGRVYRSDSDQTHTPMFHQIEALVIDEDDPYGPPQMDCSPNSARRSSRWTKCACACASSHFPFTEPSMEVDIGAGGDRQAAAAGWRSAASGMVHPNVITACGLDPERYQGFAFGMGIDRIAMLKYGIPDLRAFFGADLRWLKHYGFLPLRRADAGRRAVVLSGVPKSGLPGFGKKRCGNKGI